MISFDNEKRKKAPMRSPTTSPTPWGLSMGASSGATHHLGAMQKPQAKSKSTATTKAFKPRRDAPLTASPCRLGASESLAARAALPSVFSQAPRRAPRLGTPFGGASRAMPARPARSAGLALDAPPQTSSVATATESVCPRPRARRQRGCPSAERAGEPVKTRTEARP